MLTDKEIVALLRSRKIHWTLKMRFVKAFQERYPEKNVEQIAYTLNIKPDTVYDYLKLAQYSTRFSSLRRIVLMSEAIHLVKTYHFDEKLLRQKIQIAVAMNKTKLRLKEITKNVSAIAEENKKSKRNKIRDN